MSDLEPVDYIANKLANGVYPGGVKYMFGSEDWLAFKDELRKREARAAAAARIEGIEMCHNALFHDASSVSGTITLDTGETAIRYNDLLRDPDAALNTKPVEQEDADGS